MPKKQSLVVLAFTCQHVRNSRWNVQMPVFLGIFNTFASYEDENFSLERFVIWNLFQQRKNKKPLQKIPESLRNDKLFFFAAKKRKP